MSASLQKHEIVTYEVTSELETTCDGILFSLKLLQLMSMPRSASCQDAPAWAVYARKHAGKQVDPAKPYATNRAVKPAYCRPPRARKLYHLELAILPTRSASA